MYKNFWNEVILLNLNEFENIGVNFYINIFLFFCAVLVCVIAISFELSRGVMFTTVKQLLRHGALSKDTAMTLDELGLSRSRFVSLAIKHNSRLPKILTMVDKIEISYDEYVKLDKKQRREVDNIDFKTARFYISEDHLETAKRVYSTYNVSVFRIVLFCVLVFILYFAIAALGSELLCYLNSQIG